MEADLQDHLVRMENDFREGIAELIDRTRDDITEKAIVHDREVQQAEERLITARSRRIRALENENRQKLRQLRLDRLESGIREELERFRCSEDYLLFLNEMLYQCQSGGYSGRGRIVAETHEAECLRAMGVETDITEEELGRWGGFILIDEGGALFDCTLKTRWDQYCRQLADS